MKRIIQYIKRSVCLLPLSLLIFSCSDFLEEDPQDRIALNNYYTTEADAIAAVNSIYAWLGSYDFSAGNTAGIYHSTFWVAQGLASDEMHTQQAGTPHFDQLDVLAHNSENAAALEIWQIHYKTINLANIAIERIPHIEMDETLRTRLVNEAKFLRGLLYFNLVRMYGKVPLLLKENEPLQPHAAEVDDIYAQIISDLTDAENLPLSYLAGNGKGRATSGAAKALLAKVYLTLEDYENSADKAREVIDSEQYDLWDDYADVFKYSSRNGKEAVFSVSFGDGEGAISFWEVAQFNVRLLPTALTTEINEIANTQGWQYATDNLYAAFDPSDERRAVTFMTEFTKPDNSVATLDKVYIQKYWDQEANPTTSPCESDFPVIRYSDVLLMYAEAQAELENFEDANDYLGMVKERADLTHTDVNNITDFREAILLERRKEFVGEGHRWFDLVRMGKLEEKTLAAKGVTPSPDYYLFPVPLRERDLNPNLPQNDGF